MVERCDVVVIGAGPAGAIAAKRLYDAGCHVIVLEKQQFPRFVIGESLLPQSMVYLERAGLIEVVEKANFQYKNGANFQFPDGFASIDFSEKTADGWDTTFQVQRQHFDKILADAVEKAGISIHYQCEVIAAHIDPSGCELQIQDHHQNTKKIECDFVMDASGYGRVLPRLLNLDQPSDFPSRTAFFTHIHDQLDKKEFDRNKILISVHEKDANIWSWLIPFSNNVSSIGIVMPTDKSADNSQSNAEILWQGISGMTELKNLLSDAKEIRSVSKITGYSANVRQLAGERFALLGNAAEFLDPVFSSGVTIAMKSADLAVDAYLKQKQESKIDWTQEYVRPLMVGVDCFREFVSSWYDGRLQRIIKQSPNTDNDIKRMITSILAGYAWDQENAFVRRPAHYINLVAAQCE
ncbi:FAD-dependent oxidoreductase [Rhodospirillaceae bacterium RKSG073]|nr:FAD-dependent oxidoreductase [Curvivirga aplysinae]